MDYTITVTAESGYCAGHFPGHPVVPGAAQLAWVLQYLAERCGVDAESMVLRSMKCLNEFTPGIEVCVTHSQQSGRIAAKVFSDQTVFSEYRFHLSEAGE